MPDLKFAIVGCGRIAQRHACHMMKHGRLIAVCDIDPQKANALASEYSARGYYALDDMLAQEKDLDVVAVCTPNGLHASQSISILEAGFHVLCEKPMAVKTSDCVKMIQAARKSNKMLFVVKQNRFNPPVVAVKNLIDEGKLGKIYSVQVNCFWNRDPLYYKNSWKGSKELDGGTLFTQFSHFIDIMYWLVGDIKSVIAKTGNFGHKDIIEIEDTGIALLEFANGAVGTLNYTVNSYRKNMEGSITIFGEKGTVKVGGEYLNRIEYQNIEGCTIEDLPDGRGANQYGTYQGSMSNHDKVYENLSRFFLHQEPYNVAPEEGLKTVEIIEKIYCSSHDSMIYNEEVQERN